MSRATMVVLLAFVLSAGSAAAQATHAHEAGHSHGPGESHTRLLEGLGDWSMPVSTRSADAQQWFDQGLRLTYAFNHDEAVRSFEEAVRIDAECALCWWGIAYALGPNINLPLEPELEPRALEAIRRAARLWPRATPKERALIGAMSLRYDEPAGAARAARDSAYAAAMREVARTWQDDADVQTLFADAMMNLRPWDQWTREGRPQPGTEEVVATLERVLGRVEHAGACHFYVHAIEASPQPERALRCAELLPRLMPGAGHIVHMPAHIYLRVGMYAEAARANIAAVEADGRYFESHEVVPGIYPLFYAPHNLHFLWAVYVLAGERQAATDAAAALVERVSPEDAREAPSLEAFLTAPVLTRVRFADWAGVLAEPEPPAELRYLTGMWHHARGIAFAALKDVRSARAELDSVRAVAGRLTSDVIIILNDAPSLLALAAETLEGGIAAAEGRVDDAVAHLRRAIAMEDALTYDEPPPWYHPVRNVLGSVLLDAGRVPEAEQAFRDDLRMVRNNAASLEGLERALRQR